ncbi:MAG: hypothetical protein R3B90_12840 [Planctomycetaceae bacterium]
MSAFAFLGCRCRSRCGGPSKPAGRRFFDPAAFKAAFSRPTLVYLLLTMFLTMFGVRGVREQLPLLTRAMGMSGPGQLLRVRLSRFHPDAAQVSGAKNAAEAGERKAAIFGTVLMTIGLAAGGVCG